MSKTRASVLSSTAAFTTTVTTAIAVLTVAILGCSERPADWSPVLEETSTTFLETETERVLNEIASALEQLRTDPDQAEAALEQAVRSLEAINNFYLPLFQAREKAYNAFRYLRLGDSGQVTRELEAIETTLTSMVQKAEGGPLAELQALAEAVAGARVAVEAGTEEGAAALEELARKLNQAVLKGDLILR